ncbi:hypothetical protein TNCV_3972361 [Trichonephila clavipes]|nr:hypothetical protein TNCV_3972361 [Trichonephila clavipes]
MQKSVREPCFPASVSFADKESFSRGVFNAHNSQVWVYDNPHGTKSHAAQHRFVVNVWNGRTLGAVPVHIRQDMWFHHDGASGYCTVVVRDYLNQKYGA